VIKSVPIKNFLNTGFRSFSTYDCKINIPNLIDGFKISQRKSVFAINKANKLNTVERWSAQVASDTAYHHGAASLEGVIVGLAQNFPASNNVNWFTPDGQFGNILNHTASSGRYISVEISPNFRKWFSKEDDLILEHEEEDGEQIEPRYFIPKVPTILFNGTSGIGTGYACTILNYNPADVTRNVLQVLNGKKQTKLVPWYAGYNGKIVKEENQTIFYGNFERINSVTLKITQLPIGYDLEKYKGILSKLIEKEVIKDYDDNSTEEGWDITIHCRRDLTSQDDSTIIEKLNLISRESENITVWDESGKIKTFDGPEDLIEYFVKIRLGFYEKRRNTLIDGTTSKIDWGSERLRFIKFYLSNSKKFRDTSKADLIVLLKENEFENYDQLLQMPIWNLTHDKIKELENEINELLKRLNTLKEDTAQEMFIRELKALQL
jgi:DNA topoisomerase-2